MTAPDILIITTVRDEAPHLLEWVAHYRALGARILAFSNDCGDGSDGMLALLDKAGILTHVANPVPAGRTPQWSALKLAADHPAAARADWIAVLDTDEFVSLGNGIDSLAGLIDAAGTADAIAMPWRLFGHAGHARRPAAMTLRAYTHAIRAEARYPALGGFFKTLYRRAGPFQKPGVHRPRQKPGTAARWRDGSGNALPDAVAANADQILLWNPPPGRALVELNHYSVRSAEDFLMKTRRGLPNRHKKRIDLTYWVERNFNEVAAPRILAMADATEAELARLRALPGLAGAEAEGLAWHGAAFERALDTPEGIKLYGRLLLAAGSTSPGVDLALDLVRRFGQAAGAR